MNQESRVLQALKNRQQVQRYSEAPTQADEQLNHDPISNPEVYQRSREQLLGNEEVPNEHYRPN